MATAADNLGLVVEALIGIVLAQRAVAWARQDFAAADAMRRRLAEVGTTIHDTERASRWEFNTAPHA